MLVVASFGGTIRAESCAIGLILCCWISIFLVVSGLGSMLRIPFKVREADLDDAFLCFWLGFSVLLVFLQLWHLYRPVNTAAVCVLAAFGGTGHAVTRAAILRPVWRAFIKLPRRFAICLLLLVIWAANHATDAPNLFDSGNYHFPVIRWVTSYPIVKGIGNIDGLLAFNNVSLLYQGALEIGVLRHRSAHIGNGILLLVVLVFFGLKIRGAFIERQFAPQALFALTLITPLVFSMPSISSPNTDLPSVLMLFVIAYFLVGLASSDERRISAEALAFRVVVLAALCCQALAVKLSVAVYSGSACLVFSWMWVMTRRVRMQYRVKVGAVVAATVLGSVTLWTGRNVLLSGYPFFPSLAFKFPVAWRIPEFYAGWDGWWIRTFARAPFREDISGEGVQWIHRWLSVELPAAKIEGMLPVLLASLALTSLGIRIVHGRHLRMRYSQRLLAWLPLILSIPLWFCSAPSVRFGTALLWILAAQSAAIAVQHALNERGRAGVVALQVLCLLPVAGIVIQIWPMHENHHDLRAAVERALWVAPGPDHGLHPAHITAVERIVSDNGVTLYRPKHEPCADGRWPDCLMWYGPLPAPGWYGTQVGSRIKENLTYLSAPFPGGGFAIRDTQQQWLSRHVDEIRRMARATGMNLRQLTYYFQVEPEVIRAALRPDLARVVPPHSQGPDAKRCSGASSAPSPSPCDDSLVSYLVSTIRRCAVGGATCTTRLRRSSGRRR